MHWDRHGTRNGAIGIGLGMKLDMGIATVPSM